jgi:hypothetical protein
MYTVYTYEYMVLAYPNHNSIIVYAYSVYAVFLVGKCPMCVWLSTVRMDNFPTLHTRRVGVCRLCSTCHR